MERILILDDSIYGSELAETLRSNGYSTQYVVEAVRDIDSAILKTKNALDERRPFDVFLIDQRLGKRMNGIEAMEKLKKLSPDSDAIIFTGWGNPGDGVKAYEAGAFQHLLKPFDPEELFHILESLGVWRKINREHKWLQANKELLEKASTSASYKDAALAIMDGLVKLEAQNVFIFRNSTEDKSRLIGVCQIGDVHISNFEDKYYEISKSPLLDKVNQSKKIVEVLGKDVIVSLFDKSLGEQTFPYREWVAAPFRFENKLVGLAIIGFSPSSNVHTQMEPGQFQEFIRMATINLERARSVEEMNRKDNLRMRAAFRIIDAVGTASDLSEILSKVTKILKDAFVESKPNILLFNEMDKLLEFTTSSDKYYHIESEEYIDLSAIRLDDASIASRVARRSIEAQEIILENIPDVLQDLDYLELIRSTNSELCVSLFSEADKKLLGVLVVERKEQNGFGVQEEQLARAFAKQLTLAISRIQQRSRLNFMHSVSAITTWAADFAHDLNREIGVIRNYSYLIDEDALSEEQAEYLGKIKSSAGRLAALTPIGAENKEFELDVFVQKTIQEIVQQREEDLQLDFIFSCGDLRVNSNPVILQRVLKHLVRNAAREMEETENKLLRVKTAILENEMIQIIIQDSGPGVREDLRPIIFENPISKGVGEGGYGLLVSRLLVESIGGEIRLLPSEPEEGAIFSIKIPIKVSVDKEEEE